MLLLYESIGCVFTTHVDCQIIDELLKKSMCYEAKKLWIREV